MTDADFDSYMLEVYGPTETKRAGLAVSGNAKRATLGYEQSTPAMMTSIEDADSFRLAGQTAGTPGGSGSQLESAQMPHFFLKAFS